MYLSPRRQSWLDFVNQTIGNGVKNEAIDCDLQGMLYASNGAMNYSVNGSKANRSHPNDEKLADPYAFPSSCDRPAIVQSEQTQAPTNNGKVSILSLSVPETTALNADEPSEYG